MIAQQPQNLGTHARRERPDRRCAHSAGKCTSSPAHSDAQHGHARQNNPQNRRWTRAHGDAERTSTDLTVTPLLARSSGTASIGRWNATSISSFLSAAVSSLGLIFFSVILGRPPEPG